MTTETTMTTAPAANTDDAIFAAMEPHEPGQFATHATPLIRNCWYVAARAEEVGRTPLARKLLGTDVVLYRTESGEPVAMRNRCPHRSFPLAKGKLVGNRTGWSSNPTGSALTCRRCPAPRPLSRSAPSPPPTADR
jgi:phenylpropionate dioxygenase-like ring-hydroxylating dioxygenase large terminal subunit